MKVNGSLSLDQLRKRQRQETDVGRSQRLQIIVLARHGWTAPAIAMAVGLSRRICQRWVARYNKFGVDGLDDQRGQEAGLPLTEPQQADFQQRIDAGPKPDDGVCTLRGRDFKRILDEEFKVLRSLSSVYRWLHQLGYRSLCPRPRHHKGNPEQQVAFQQQLPQRLQTIADAHPDKKLQIYFEDETRFGQQGTTTRVWARCGSRPTAVRQTEYEYLWVIGAACPATGHADGLLCSSLNTAMINLFLQQFAPTIPADEHAVLIWDGAGYHTSKQLIIPANVTVMQLPPYSPELNPMENLWHYLKSHYWSNRTYADYDDLEAAAMQAWQTAVLDTELMKTVCAAPYAKRATSD
jgi:transposase